MKKALIFVTIFSLAYGLTIVVQQSVLRSDFHPLHLNFYIYTLVSLILTAYMVIFKRQELNLKTLPRKGAALSALAGIVGITADILVFYGLTHSSSINWGIIFRLSVLSTFFFSALLLKEKFSPIKILAAAVSIIGAIIIVFKPDWSLSFNWGDLFFWGAMVSFGLLNVIGQKAMEELSAMQHTYIRMLVGAIILTAVPLFIFPIREVGPIGIILFNGLATLVGVVMVSLTIKSAGATFFSIGSNLVVLFVMIFSVFLLGEWPTILQVIGGLIVVSSIFLFESGKLKRKDGKPELQVKKT